MNSYIFQVLTMVQNQQMQEKITMEKGLKNIFDRNDLYDIFYLVEELWFSYHNLDLYFCYACPPWLMMILFFDCRPYLFPTKKASRKKNCFKYCSLFFLLGKVKRNYTEIKWFIPWFFGNYLSLAFWKIKKFLKKLKNLEKNQ